MAQVIIQGETLAAIADAIRESNGTTSKYKPSEMPAAINNIADPYAGEYEIVPDIDAQTLVTKDKRLADNLIIREIPYHEVDNTFSGTTVIIGGEKYGL